jgi:hypothetical protein
MVKAGEVFGRRSSRETSNLCARVFKSVGASKEEGPIPRAHRYRGRHVIRDMLASPGLELPAAAYLGTGCRMYWSGAYCSPIV